MSSIPIEALGITQEEFVDRVVDTAATRLLSSIHIDEDGDEISKSSKLATRIKEEVMTRIDQRVAELSERHLRPIVESKLDQLVLQRTTKWGEKVGSPQSFVEYVVAQAENYMIEPVNSEGQSKRADSYSWKPYGPRISFMMDRHLNTHIQSAVERIVKAGNDHLVEGITQAVKTAMEKILISVKATSR